MRRALSLAALLLVSLSLPAFPLQAADGGVSSVRPADIGIGRYTALLIGIDDYQQMQDLESPQNDIRRIGNVLRDSYGFEVRTLIGPQATRQGILDGLTALQRDSGPDDAILVYFAGHGTEAEGDGFWIPWDATQSDSSWIAQTDIARKIKAENMRARHVLVVSDACYSGALYRDLSSTKLVATPSEVSRARDMAKDVSRYLITSGGKQPVLDNGKDGLSWFAYFFAKELEAQPGPFVVADSFFPRLREQVETNARQRPLQGRIFGAGDELGQLVLVRKGASAAAGSATSGPAGPVGPSVTVSSSGTGESFMDRLARHEAAQKELEAAEAARAATEQAAQKAAAEAQARIDAAKKAKAEADAQLARDHRRYFDEASTRLRKEAAEAWTATKPLLGKGGEVAKATAQDFVKEYGGRVTTLRDASGTYTERVVIPEVVEAQAWIDSHQGGSQAGASYELKVGGVLYTMVPIPAGTFTMGSPGSEAGRGGDETQHEVRITEPFYIGETEVTQGLWEAVMGSNPSHFSSCGADCPVENISWCDAVIFTNELSGKAGLPPAYGLPSGFTVGMDQDTCNKKSASVIWNSWAKGYRLPTEAEWEYAARGGQSRTWSGSRSVDEVAWHRGNSRSKTHRVGTMQENGHGLFDMSGNVYEWSWDWYASYPSGSVQDPIGPQSGSFRVYRGGSWRNDARYARVAIRDNYGPGYRDGNLGFRLSRSGP